MKDQKQIERLQYEMDEMLEIIERSRAEYANDVTDHSENEYIREGLLNAGYRKQDEGEWEWFEEWSPSTPEHPRECDDCGWRCGECKVALEDMVGGYWDDPHKEPKLHFCPNCGARMKGETYGREKDEQG